MLIAESRAIHFNKSFVYTYFNDKLNLARHTEIRNTRVSRTAVKMASLFGTVGAACYRDVKFDSVGINLKRQMAQLQVSFL